MQSSDSSSPSAVAPVVPRKRPTTWWTLLLRPVTGAPKPASSWRLVTGPPPVFSRWRYEASQVSGPSSARVPRFLTPPLALLSRPLTSGALLPSRYQALSAQGTTLLSEPTHAAHSLACLRIAYTHENALRGRNLSRSREVVEVNLLIGLSTETRRHHPRVQQLALRVVRVHPVIRYGSGLGKDPE